MKIGIYSYATDDLNKEILIYQKMVFDKFDLNLNQVVLPKSKPSPGQFYNYDDHPNFIMDVIKKTDVDYFMFFDIDCIPLNESFYEKIVNQIKDKNTLSGAVGCANHKDFTKKYIHPCFMAFSKKLYFDCFSPDLRESDKGDVVQSFTDSCIENNKKIVYWNVTNGGDELWRLPNTNQKFGHGTTYENVIYHQFEIRFEKNHIGFVQKCKEVLNK